MAYRKEGNPRRSSEVKLSEETQEAEEIFREKLEELFAKAGASEAEREEFTDVLEEYVYNIANDYGIDGVQNGMQMGAENVYHQLEERVEQIKQALFGLQEGKK